MGKWIMRLIGLMIIVGSLVGGCSYLNKKLGLKDDNVLEELIEHRIEEETGFDVDLSPASREK